jgi:ribosomal protein S18 acetylase RimI-like enzyme
LEAKRENKMPGTISLQQITPTEREMAVALLKDADEGEERIWATVSDETHTTYVAREGERVIGAATMRWDKDESEIIYIAVVPKARARGNGKAIMALLLAEGRRRNVRSVLVGTANSSLANIAFYQKCGFRMDHVRKGYFDYIQPPIIENGILMRDMLVLRCDLTES